MNDTPGTTEAGTPTIARRTIVKGAAWSIPVIAAAVAAPAQAASTTTPVIEIPTGTVITGWKGDHRYGSENDNPKRRSYDFPIVVKDAAGNPIAGATVTVVAAGANDDGDLISVHRWPAPDDDGPESDPNRTATLTTDGSGRALFAVNTQNLTSSELRKENTTATLTVSVTYNGVTTTDVVTVRFTESD